ncbi:hypothetical protein LOD99_3209 [Oopsacas minuta]|uniref:HTH OST-type domain-containing protein n=1 Tax=Oopsacas minuta TaxID=111878 RepID=A0AAV7JYZ2_9METZ|nr:hypothetical protein LOD99_3209 [Oopsacas minuta]
MLCDIPDTVRVSRDCAGQIRLFGVANQDTAHIADMVKKQKKGSFNPYKPPPKTQGVQQTQRGRRGGMKPHLNSRYNNNFSTPRPTRFSSQYTRSQTLPPSNKFEFDTFSTSSYSNNRCQQVPNNSRGAYHTYRTPPNHYHSSPQHMPHSNPPFNPSYNNYTAQGYHNTQAYHNTQSYDYQDRSPKYSATFNNDYREINSSLLGPDALSPNRNSHKLHGIKDAIYDLLYGQPDGIPGSNFENEYYRVFRSKLPYCSLGYPNAKQFIESIPDVVRIENVDGKSICYLATRVNKQVVRKESESESEWPDTISFTTESLLSPIENTANNKSIIKPQENNGITEDKINNEVEIFLREDEKKRHMNELKSKICVFLLNKDAPVPVDELEDQYRALNREDPEIPYRILGYSSIKEFLRDIMDVVILVTNNKDGSMSVVLKTHNTSPPSPKVHPRPPIHINNQPFRSRMPNHQMLRPFPAPPIHPNFRPPFEHHRFIPPVPPMHHIHPQRLPPPNQHPHLRYPLPPPPPPHIIPGYHFVPHMSMPPNHHEPPGFESSFSPPLHPAIGSVISPTEALNEFPAISLDDAPVNKPFPDKPFTTRINTLCMDFSKAQKEFVQTQILSITDVRKEIKLRVTCEIALRYLEGSNVAVLAGENQGKCACMSVALTNGLNMLTDNVQSLIICNDVSGVDKIFECMKIICDNTGLKVTPYQTADKLRSFHAGSQIIVLEYSLLEMLLKKCDISQLTRIGVYNVATEPNTFNELIKTLKRIQSVKLQEEFKYFIATNPHNEVGSYILKMVNTLMNSKCYFTYYGREQENCLILVPHEAESTQIHTDARMLLRPSLLACINRKKQIPNHFDKYLIPLRASCNNFTILSQHIEEGLLQQSLALLTMIKVEPSSHLTQVVIIVPNELQAKDFLELCGDMGQGEGIKVSMVNSKTTKEDIRYSHICIGWPKEIASSSNNCFAKITMVIIYRIDLERKMNHLAELFQNCQSPQVVVVGSSYTRNILNFESKYMSEPRHITFLARETY